MTILNDLYLSRKPLAGFIAIGCAWSVYFAQMPVIKAQVGASDGAYGVAVLFASFGALGAMWLAPLSHRLLGSLALPIAIAVIAVGIMGVGFATELYVLGLMMLVVSAGSGVTDVLINANVSETEAREGRTLMNLNHGLYSLSYAAAALATGMLREAGVPPVPIFSGLAVFLMLLAWGSWGVKPELVDTQEDLTIPAVMPMWLIWLAGGVVFIAFLSEASAEGWSALHLERTLGGDPGEGALGPALLGLTMGIGRLTGHGLARFMRDTTLMMLACGMSAIGLMVAGLAGSVAVALLGFALAGLGISVVAPLALALVGRVVPRRYRLAAISRVSVLGFSAFFFGPPLMGLVSQGFGLRASFLTVAAVLVVVAASVIPTLARRVAAQS